MRLIIYVPSGVGELEGVLRANAELVRPSELIVFTDDARYCVRGLPSDVHCVGYGGAEALLGMLRIAEPGDVIVNGAVLTDKFIKYYEVARKLDSKLVGVADINEGLGRRDLVINGVPHARVLHGNSPPFFKPSLAVIVNGRPFIDYIDYVLSVMSNVPGAVRRCVDEGVVLGMYALMTGQSVVPWFPGARRVGGDYNVCSRHLSAYANYMFFRSLVKGGVYITGVNNHALMIRYLLDALIHW